MRRSGFVGARSVNEGRVSLAYAAASDLRSGREELGDRPQLHDGIMADGKSLPSTGQERRGDKRMVVLAERLDFLAAGHVSQA